MTGDLRTAMAGRRLRKQSAPWRAWPEDGRTGPSWGTAEGCGEPRTWGPGPRAAALLQAELGPCCPRTGLPARHGGGLALPLQVSALRGATPGHGARTAPESQGHAWVGLGRLPGGGGCGREEVTGALATWWLDAAAPPPPVLQRLGPLGTGWLCDRVSPVGQLTGHSSPRV